MITALPFALNKIGSSKMKKVLFVIVFFISAGIMNSQVINSIQLSGGAVFPSSSYTGSNVGIEISKELNNTFSFYVSASYARWGCNKVSISGIYSELTSYTEDQHQLIPILLGSKITITTIKTFRIFGEFELGYNYLQYNSYENIATTDPTTNKVTTLYVDQSSRKENNESTFGFGLGVGFINKISDLFSLLVEYKRNSIINTLDNVRTNYGINAGLIFNL